MARAHFVATPHDKKMNAPTKSLAMRLLSQSAVPARILSVLESLRCGGFLLDLRGRVLSLNLLALGCLGDGLVLGGEHLSAPDRETDRRLQHLVSTSLRPARNAGRPTSVAVPRPFRLPLVVRTLSLDETAQRTPGSASLLLLVIDPELRPEPPREDPNANVRAHASGVGGGDRHCRRQDARRNRRYSWRQDGNGTGTFESCVLKDAHSRPSRTDRSTDARCLSGSRHRRKSRIGPRDNDSVGISQVQASTSVTLFQTWFSFCGAGLLRRPLRRHQPLAKISCGSIVWARYRIRTEQSATIDLASGAELFVHRLLILWRALRSLPSLISMPHRPATLRALGPQLGRGRATGYGLTFSCEGDGGAAFCCGGSSRRHPAPSRTKIVRNLFMRS